MTAALARSRRTAPVPLAASTPSRVRPAPRREPPFDDELRPAQLVAVGPLDPRLPFFDPEPERSGVATVLPLRPLLPDPAGWGRRLLVGVIETAAGQRPLAQLAALVSPSVWHGLTAAFERAALQGRPHWAHTATVNRVHAARTNERVAELCATVQVGERVRAVALRVEARDGRWRCTRLMLG